MVTGQLLVRLSLPVSILPKRAKSLAAPQVDEEQRPMSYSQVFQLNPDGSGSYFVFNDIFRLVYS